MALRAGPVGLRCEAGLGPSRGWGSGRPAAPLLVPVFLGSVARGGAGVSVSPPLLPGPRPRRPLSPSPGGGRRRRSGRGGRGGGRASLRSSSAAVRGGCLGRGAPRRAAATLDVRRALLADLRSYGSRRAPRPRGGRAGCAPSSRRGRPFGRPGRGVRPARCLGRRLAAGLELVRTRGIRLFN